METVTFSQFRDVSRVGVPFVMSLTTADGYVDNMAAVFVDLVLFPQKGGSGKQTGVEAYTAQC